MKRAGEGMRANRVGVRSSRASLGLRVCAVPLPAEFFFLGDMIKLRKYQEEAKIWIAKIARGKCDVFVSAVSVMMSRFGASKVGKKK